LTEERERDNREQCRRAPVHRAQRLIARVVDEHRPHCAGGAAGERCQTGRKKIGLIG